MLQIDEWLGSMILGRKPSAGINAVLNVVRQDPAAASFMSAHQVAERANVNAATAVRAAQFIGFSGWSAMKAELRHRYLATMTAEKLLDEHGGAAPGPARSTLANDADNLRTLQGTAPEEGISRLAAMIAGAQRTLVIATGSYAAAGYQLAHVGQMIGHDIELHTSPGTGLVNRIRLLQEGDCVLSCNLWRSSKFVPEIVRLCVERGLRIAAIADRQTSITDLAEETILVPSEGVSFVPSIVGAVSVVQALLAELAAVDPARTTAALHDIEGMWSALDLVDPA